MTVSEEMRRDYRVALLRYLPRREEAPLRVAYEMGRSAVVTGITILELVELHNGVFNGIVQQTAPEDIYSVTAAASEFLMEALATYDMTQRSLLERPGEDGPA
jgi:Phosphoserine phosphatase RsbU, N-terminal domain